MTDENIRIMVSIYNVENISTQRAHFFSSPPGDAIHLLLNKNDLRWRLTTFKQQNTRKIMKSKILRLFPVGMQFTLVLD